MAITKEKKNKIVTDLKNSIKNAGAVVFVHYKGLPVGEETKLRGILRDQSVGYQVVKKTLIKKVFEGEFKGEAPNLDGEIAIAFGEDQLAPAREVYNFHKTHKDQVKIVGGVFEGEYKDEAAMLSIATIPGEKELKSMFVNILNSPIQSFVVALNAKAELSN